MDGVLSVVFTAALGIGTAFSVFPVAIYQGSITLLAGAGEAISHGYYDNQGILHWFHTDIWSGP